MLSTHAFARYSGGRSPGSGTLAGLSGAGFSCSSSAGLPAMIVGVRGLPRVLGVGWSGLVTVDVDVTSVPIQKRLPDDEQVGVMHKA